MTGCPTKTLIIAHLINIYRIHNASAGAAVNAVTAALKGTPESQSTAFMNRKGKNTL